MKQFLFALACCCLLPGCIVETNDREPVVDSGSLILDWTIDGSKNPDECDQGDAVTLDITVSTLSGAPVGEFQESCRAFATSIDLAPGNYNAEAVLLDPAGHDRTTVVQTGPFTIYGNDELSVPVDFPASSFY